MHFLFQGESIQEKACDNSLPECPGAGSSEEELEEEEDPEEYSYPRHHHHHNHDLHLLQLQNGTTPPGCECGCILHDLETWRNDTLVIFISSNYSSPCSDEDEVDHHKFKWILHVRLRNSLFIFMICHFPVHLKSHGL